MYDLSSRCNEILTEMLFTSVDEPVVYGLGLAVKLQEKTSFALNSK